MNKILQVLNLSPPELAALSEQGFVHASTSPHGRVGYKLRFRLEGRQRVVSLGSDPARAAEVQEQLSQLQRSRQLKSELKALRRRTTQLFQHSKQCLQPLLASAGLHFHGRSVRRRRAVATGNENETRGA